jgi:heat shock protein HtpX
MTTLYTHQDSNIARTWVLMALFFAVVVGVGWALSYWYQSPEILWIALVVSLGMNAWSYWFSDKVALAVSRAQPASRERYFDLYTVTENLAITAGLPMPKLYVIDDPAPNAFATGRNKDHAAVAVTTGLLSRLDRTELEGVIAHELSHIGNRDILLSSVVVVLVGFLSLIADFFLRGALFGGGRNNDSRAGGVLAIVGLILIILSPVIATLIQLAISRKREFLADASGALLSRYPEGLASALEKIAAHPAPLRSAHQATAHLFISNPFGPKSARGLSRLFMTHPPVEERIHALRGGAVPHENA